MSDGAKIGLILGGTAAVGYFLFFRTSAATPLAATPTTTGAPLAQSPGAPQSTGVSTAVKAGFGGLVGLASIGPSSIAKVGSTLYNIDKKVLGGAYSTVKSVDSAVVSGASSVLHGIASIF